MASSTWATWYAFAAPPLPVGPLLHGRFVVAIGTAVLMELPALAGRAAVPGEVRVLFTA